MAAGFEERKGISLIFLVMFFITMRVLWPFGQGVFPESVDYVKYFESRGLRPIITMTPPHSGVEVDCIGYACYYVAVILFGNLILNLVCLTGFYYFWKHNPNELINIT